MYTIYAEAAKKFNNFSDIPAGHKAAQYGSKFVAFRTVYGGPSGDFREFVR